MHSFWQRLNAIFFFALSVLGFLSFLGAGMTYWHVSTPRIELTLEKILLRKIYGAGHDQVGATSWINTLHHRSPASHLTPRASRLAPHASHLMPHTSHTSSHLTPHTPHDQAVLTLGIDADLRSVFNWNVKQLFVYVTAEYETDANVLNQVVVWDTIINDSPSVRAPVERSPGQRALARVAPPRAPCRATVLPTDAADTVTTRF